MTTPLLHPRIEYRDPTSGARLFDVDPVAKTIIVRLRGIEHVVSVDALVKLAYSESAVVVVLPVAVGET